MSLDDEMHKEARDATCYDGYGWSTRTIGGARFRVICDDGQYGTRFNYYATGYGYLKYSGFRLALSEACYKAAQEELAARTPAEKEADIQRIKDLMAKHGITVDMLLGREPLPSNRGDRASETRPAMKDPCPRCRNHSLVPLPGTGKKCPDQQGCGYYYRIL